MNEEKPVENSVSIPLPLSKPLPVPRPDYSLAPVIYYNLDSIGFAAQEITFDDKDHRAFIRKHSLKHGSMLWISNDDVRVLCTLVSQEPRPPTLLLHWGHKEVVSASGVEPPSARLEAE